MAAAILLKLSSVEFFVFVAFLTLLSFGDLADGKHGKTKTMGKYCCYSVCLDYAESTFRTTKRKGV